MSEKKPNTDAINDYIRNAPGRAQRFTVVQDGRSGAITTTTQGGETFEGPDSLNDAIYRLTRGAEPRNRRREDAEQGGVA